jgi:hypothetical protein
MKCPFCFQDDNAVHSLDVVGALTRPHYHVFCYVCACYGPTAPTKERAVKLWEDRPKCEAILADPNA